MLLGRSVNLSMHACMEKDELHILAGWTNDVEFMGEYETQDTTTYLENLYSKPGAQWFFIEKKDGNKIGWVIKYLEGKRTTIGYGVVPNERGKGYATEAAKIMVDYLFLTKNIVVIQADTGTENSVSQKVLKKVSFQKDGVIRKHFISSGKWRDSFLFSILREEWKAPKILKKKSKV